MAKHTLKSLWCEHVWPFFNTMLESIKMMTSLKVILKVKLYISGYWKKHLKYVWFYDLGTFRKSRQQIFLKIGFLKRGRHCQIYSTLSLTPITPFLIHSSLFWLRVKKIVPEQVYIKRSAKINRKSAENES